MTRTPATCALSRAPRNCPLQLLEIDPQLPLGLRRRLVELGISNGTSLTLDRVAIGGACLVCIDATRYIIDRQTAESLTVTSAVVA